MPIRSNRRAVQIALSLAVFQVPFTGTSMDLAMPLVVKDFSMSAFTLTFLISTYLVGTAMFQMPAARLGDLWGRRKLFLIGLSAFGIFSLLSSLAWSAASLICFRFAAGVGSAMVFATNMAILTAVFPKEERGRALGINSAVVYFAMAMGPVGGGVLGHHYGWRSIFFVSFVMSALALAAAVWSIRDEWAVAKGELFDFRGCAVYVLGIGGAVFGFSFLPGWTGWGMLAAGVAATILFARLEKRTVHPILKLEHFFRNRHFRLASLSAMINYAASFAIGLAMSLYLQVIKGMPPDRAGFLLMAQPVAQTLLSPIAGRLSDRINPSILTTSGMGAISLGLLLLSRLTAETPLHLVVPVLVLIGIGFAFFSSPNVNIIMGSVASRDSGFASATTGTVRLIGQAMSMAMTSLIIHVYMGNHELSKETAHLFLPALQTAFLLFAGICMVGVYTSASKLTGDEGDRGWRYVSVRTRVKGKETESGDGEDNMA